MNQPDVVRPNEAVKSKGAGGIFSPGGGGGAQKKQ